jgi:UDP-N-acetylglucosamine acyltransferase
VPVSAIHPTAVIDPSAELADDVEIGPYAIVEGNVRIGAGTRIMAHAYVGRNTVLGEGNVLHPGAVLGHMPQDLSTTGEEDAKLVVGNRNVFREYCTIHRGSRDGRTTVLGDDNFIMTQAHIAHDCTVGNRVILAGGALLAGHIEVEDRAFISGNVAVHQFCRIGTLAMIAGLARVSMDPPPFFLVKGDSLVYGLNHVGLERAGLSDRERSDVRLAYKLLYRKGLRLEDALARIESTLFHSPHARHLVEFVRKSQRGICGHHRRGTPRS